MISLQSQLIFKSILQSLIHFQLLKNLNIIIQRILILAFLMSLIGSNGTQFQPILYPDLMITPSQTLLNKKSYITQQQQQQQINMF